MEAFAFPAVYTTVQNNKLLRGLRAQLSHRRRLSTEMWSKFFRVRSSK